MLLPFQSAPVREREKEANLKKGTFNSATVLIHNIFILKAAQKWKISQVYRSFR